MPSIDQCSQCVLSENNTVGKAIPPSFKDIPRPLHHARGALRADTPQLVRDAAIELIRGHDPAKARSSYRFHLAIACDAHRDARTRAASLDWLVVNTASTDQLGQARLDRLRSGVMTTGEPG
ncbi:hypothetical protein [Poseidonocella sp. HB161398]|uniref:hypothetical protein n=1 Tax=Poseidonocella sp. HB161398 TaxID=2320855 RepID=UPI001109A78C|nr:hypothetical protein [Poseidonocella sp. HB161398]